MTAPAIAIDIGGSHLGCVALLRDREMLSFRSIDTSDESLHAVLPRIQVELEGLLVHGIAPSECLGVAVGFCGIRKHVEQHAWIPAGSIAIVEAQLSSQAALYGAIPLLTEGCGYENELR